MIDITENGIFASVAPKDTTGDGYDTGNSTIVKFSISEICNMAYSLELLRTKGENSYRQFSEAVLGEGFKNMQFIHINREGQKVRTGLNLYSIPAKKPNVNPSTLNPEDLPKPPPPKLVLQFVIYNEDAGSKIQFTIMAIEKIRLEKFLNYIISIAFNKGV